MYPSDSHRGEIIFAHLSQRVDPWRYSHITHPRFSDLRSMFIQFPGISLTIEQKLQNSLGALLRRPFSDKEMLQPRCFHRIAPRLVINDTDLRCGSRRVISHRTVDAVDSIGEIKTEVINQLVVRFQAELRIAGRVFVFPADISERTGLAILLQKTSHHITDHMEKYLGIACERCIKTPFDCSVSESVIMPIDRLYYQSFYSTGKAGTN